MFPFSPGQTATLVINITEEHVRRFAELSGDRAPLHTDSAFARSHGFAGPVVHGALLSAFVSQLLGMELPGRVAILERMDLAFHAPSYAPCTIVIEARVRQVSEAVSSIVMEITLTSSAGDRVAAGKSWHKVLAESEA